jgi:striatin 1/3/4
MRINNNNNNNLIRQEIQDTEMMDENSLNGAQNINQNRATGDKISEDASNGNGNVQYTIPGIIHFIEHEWQRFQAERSQWDTDRAELQVNIPFLHKGRIIFTSKK